MVDISSKRIDDLKKKIQELTARKQAEEARLKAQAKKDDTRRKILVGAFFLEQVYKEGTFEELKKKLDPFLTRTYDRVLFDLPADKAKPAALKKTSEATTAAK